MSYIWNPKFLTKRKKCIYISKNQFILGDVLSLSLSPFCKYSKNEAAAAKRILNLPTVFELLLQWVILQTIRHEPIPVLIYL